MYTNNRIEDWELRIVDQYKFASHKMEFLEQFRAFARDLCIGCSEINLPENVILHGTVGGAEVDLSQIKIKRTKYHTRYRYDPDPIQDGDFVITTSSGEPYTTSICFATAETNLLLTALLLIN